jgi:hypothetical protein
MADIEAAIVSRRFGVIRVGSGLSAFGALPT